MSQTGRRMQESPYRQWLRSEGLDTVMAHHVPDLGALPLRPWARTGGLTRFINHEDSDRSNDCRVCEIPAGGSLAPQRHLHEQMIYVMSGRGVASVWQETSGGRQSFEWEGGSLFAIPLNTRYQLFNSSSQTPARFVAVTNAPAVINLFGSADFVFGCGYEFLDRFSGEDGYFGGDGTLDGRYLETNFVPDVRTIGLHDHGGRGAGGTNVAFELARNTMKAHVSQFPVGTYKKAHRHGPGAHVIVIGGTGYSLMWAEGEPPRRYDWSEGSMITPPDRAFHQHFNVGRKPARYLALRHQRGERDPKTGLPLSMISTREGGDQIDYADEDPGIREMYRRECERHGVEFKMARFFCHSENKEVRQS